MQKLIIVLHDDASVEVFTDTKVDCKVEVLEPLYEDPSEEEVAEYEEKAVRIAKEIELMYCLY